MSEIKTDARQSWSRDGEMFDCDSLGELIDMYDDLEAGTVVHFGEVADVNLRHLCDADDVIDMMADRASDEVGEAADCYPDVTREAKDELSALLLAWMEKHAKPTFYRVVKVREYTITSDDIGDKP